MLPKYNPFQHSEILRGQVRSNSLPLPPFLPYLQLWILHHGFGIFDFRPLICLVNANRLGAARPPSPPLWNICKWGQGHTRRQG